MSVDIENLRRWIGQNEVRQDIISLAPALAMSATLDRDDGPARVGDAIPPPWHWLYFLSLPPQSEIGPDGHAVRGGFLPPVPLPRRMWAGSRIRFLRPIRVGDEAERASRIANVQVKNGQDGPLVFVHVHHEIRCSGQTAILEEHDIVYRDLAVPSQRTVAKEAAPSGEQWLRRIVPDEVLLFRYSALTFNGHRIHYDRRYVTEVEGYPGLVVHGPLIATLLLELLESKLPERCIKSFSFRAVKPLFDIHPFFVCGHQEDAETVRLWARNEDGALAMAATVTLD